ncbi:MAG: class I tRNA ligase family protein, partial [Pseudomonadota bacterium]
EWMYNIQDWCISRQLWWGHRIPAWYDEAGNVYVGDSEAAVRAENGIADDVVLTQDEDVLDTWFSSALWPFSTLGWPERTDRLETFYPTSVLVTGFDIIFFWVARMIMMGLKFMGDVPFRDIYITGLVRDAHGQKMSKSKGNILDPIDLIDGIDLEPLVEKMTRGLMQPQMAPAIEKRTREDFPEGIRAYGTDALRFTFAALATQGRDVSFDVGRISGYRNFCNKLWNAARFVLGNAEGQPVDPRPDHRSTFDRWILDRLDQTTEAVTANMAAYRFDLVAQALYEFTWNEYCDWYLELTKPVMYGDSEPEQRATRYVLLTVLERVLRLMHPIMPFITEDIWQRVAPLLGIDGSTVCREPFPVIDASLRDDDARGDTAWFKQVLLGIRQIRGEMDIPPTKPLAVVLEAGDAGDRDRVERFGATLADLGRLESLRWLEDGDEAPESAMALADTLKLHVPLAGLIDPAEEIARLEKERSRREGERGRAQAKLGNEGFVSRAPEAVVDKERAKLAEAEAAIVEIDRQIEKLKKL